MKKCVLAVLAAILVILALPVLAEEAGIPERVFDEPRLEYSITDRNVFFIPVDFKGMPFENIEHRVTSERFFYYYVDPLGVHVFPISAGTATISLVNRQNQEDKVLLFITVEDSAVDRKGQDNPLRAFITADETIVTGNEIHAKYIILGGTGKNEYMKIRYQKVSGGIDSDTQEIWVYDMTKRKGNIKYNYDLLDGEYYRFILEVWDTDLNKATASSQLIRIKKPSDLQVMLDTIPIIITSDPGYHFNYYIKGGKKPITTNFYYRDFEYDILKKKLDGDAEQGSINYDLPDPKPYWDSYSVYSYLEVTDAARNTIKKEYSAFNSGDRDFLIKTDKPFAGVGDEVHCEMILHGKDWSWEDLKRYREFEFYYIDFVVRNDGEKEYIVRKRTKINSSITGYTYSFVCNKPGKVYMCWSGYDGNVLGCVTCVE